jgi:hypothetical protein
MSLLLKTCIWNKNYPLMVMVIGRVKDHLPNGLGDAFKDLWFKDLVHAQAIRALFLLESNTRYDL